MKDTISAVTELDLEPGGYITSTFRPHLSYASTKANKWLCSVFFSKAIKCARLCDCSLKLKYVLATCPDQYFNFLQAKEPSWIIDPLLVLDIKSN